MGLPEAMEAGSESLKEYGPYTMPPTGGDAYAAGGAGALHTGERLAEQKTVGNTIWGKYYQPWRGTYQWRQTGTTAEAAPEPTPTPEPTPAPVYPTPEPWEPVRYEFPTSPGAIGGAPSMYTAPIPSVQAPAPYDWAAEARRLAQTAQIQDIIGQLETGLAPIRTTLGELLSLSPETIQERYRAQVEVPATRYFEEQTLPHLRRGFVGPGTYWSSMRAGAEQRAGETLQEALMSQRAGMFAEQRQTALSAAEKAMALEKQAFTGRTYPYAMAMEAAPHEVQQRAQSLQAELVNAQSAMQARAQELQRWATLEELRQRERETWGYAPAGGGTYSPYWPVPPPAEAGAAGYSLGAAL